MSQLEDLLNSLVNHTPTLNQIDSIEELRAAAKAFAVVLCGYVPEGRQRSIAITHLEDCTMWGVKGIILGSND